MTEFITKGKFDNKFTTIPNSLIQNTDLTLEARGLLIFLLSKPSDWKVNVKNLSQDNDIGRDKCYKIINALIDSGYIVRNEEKVKGRYNYTEYFVYPEKQRNTNRNRNNNWKKAYDHSSKKRSVYRPQPSNDYH